MNCGSWKNSGPKTLRAGLTTLAALAVLIAGGLGLTAPAAAQSVCDTPTGEVTYQYDELGRLTRADYHPSTVEDFAYDPAGNRTTHTVTAASITPANPVIVLPLNGFTIIPITLPGSSCFSIADASAQEGSNVSFTVTRLGASVEAESVSYATSDNGSAVAGTDYTAKSGTLNFAVGVTSQPIDVTTTNDSTFEPDETFTVTLSGATGGATVQNATGTGTIIDNDIFWTQLTNSAGTLQSAGTPHYTTETLTLPFGAGTLWLLKVDSSGEIVATWFNGVQTPTAGYRFPVATSKEVEVDSEHYPPSGQTSNPSWFSIAGSSGQEGGNITFTVSRGGATDELETVNYQTSDGTAVASSDYTAKAGTLSFAAGVTSQPAVISTVNDSTAEPTETFTVTLDSPTGGATLVSGQESATGTITDDDLTWTQLTNSAGTLQSAAVGLYTTDTAGPLPDGTTFWFLKIASSGTIVATWDSNGAQSPQPGYRFPVAGSKEVEVDSVHYPP